LLQNRRSAGKFVCHFGHSKVGLKFVSGNNHFTANASSWRCFQPTYKKYKVENFVPISQIDFICAHSLSQKLLENGALLKKVQKCV